MVHEGQLTEKFEVKTGVRQGRMPAITISVYLSHRLDHESCHKPEKKRDPVDLAVAVGRPGLCGRSSATVTQPSTDAGKTSDLRHTSAQVGLTLNKQKTKTLRINVGTDEPVKIELRGGTGGS